MRLAELGWVCGIGVPDPIDTEGRFCSDEIGRGGEGVCLADRACKLGD